MISLTLTEPEISAMAKAMIELGMLDVVPAETRPTLPRPIAGRESECIQADLGVPTVHMDSRLTAYLEELEAYRAWHPDVPRGVSAHKMATIGWLITPAEASAAIQALNACHPDRQAAISARHCAALSVAPEVWGDWLELLQVCAVSGRPLAMADPGRSGPFALAEIVTG